MSVLVDVVGRLIALGKRREEVGHILYDSFVKPLMADMDVLHQDYLTTFRKYRATLVVKQDLDEALLDEIAADSLFSEDLRAKVRSFGGDKIDRRITPLVNAIKTYLTLATTNPLAEWTEASYSFVEHFQPTVSDDFDVLPVDNLDDEVLLELESSTIIRRLNVGRALLQGKLRDLLRANRIEPKVRVRLAIRLVESLARELQARRAVVARAHERVRHSLLAPI